MQMILSNAPIVDLGVSFSEGLLSRLAKVVVMEGVGEYEQV